MCACLCACACGHACVFPCMFSCCFLRFFSLQSMCQLLAQLSVAVIPINVYSIANKLIPIRHHETKRPNSFLTLHKPSNHLLLLARMIYDTNIYNLRSTQIYLQNFLIQSNKYLNVFMFFLFHFFLFYFILIVH